MNENIGNKTHCYLKTEIEIEGFWETDCITPEVKRSLIFNAIKNGDISLVPWIDENGILHMHSGYKYHKGIVYDEKCEEEKCVNRNAVADRQSRS